MAFPPKKGRTESKAMEKKESKLPPFMKKADAAKDAKAGVKEPIGKKPMPFSPGFKKGGIVKKGKC